MTLTALVAGNRQLAQFNSFRLVRGDIARSLAAYCGHGVYLDVALAWVVGRWTTGPVTLRPDRGRPSGYTFRRLLAHFGRLLLTAGTRPLRLISVLGVLSVLFGGRSARSSCGRGSGTRSRCRATPPSSW